MDLEEIFHIFVKTLSGKSVLLGVQGSYRVEKLKQAIENELGILVFLRSLTFLGKSLQDVIWMLHLNIKYEADDWTFRCQKP